MPAVLQTISQWSRKFPGRTARQGWIGIDVGAQVTKLAQVRRDSDGYQWGGRWTVGGEETPTLTHDLLRAGVLATRVSSLTAARRMFRGRLAAAALPADLVDLRPLELPNGPWHELRAMIDQELAADMDGNSEYEFDAWTTQSDDSLTHVVAAVADKAMTVRAAEDLATAGFDCGVIDVTACALARAVAMAAPSATEPSLVLDLGYTSTQLLLIHNGQPVLCRKLRGCALRSWMQALEEKLSVSSLECRQLLTRFGVPATNQDSRSAAGSIYGVIARELEHLADEVRRTAQFAKFQMRLPPEQLWLTGGGATIRNLAALLAQQTELNAAAWSLASDTNCDHFADPLFAAAAGLSALAWENDSWA